MSHLSQLQGIEEQHMLSQRQELVPSGGLGGRQFLKDTEDSDMQEDDFLVSRFPEQVVDIGSLSLVYDYILYVFTNIFLFRGQ